MSYSILIGRFQPFHNAHYELLKKSLEISYRTVIVIGSDGQALTTKNPWTSEEREKMIRETLSSEENARVSCVYMKDSLYNDNIWVTSIQEKIKTATNNSKYVTLVGCYYDNGSYYLNLFPQWKSYLIKNMDDKPRATEIRKSFFNEKDCSWTKYVQPNVAKYLLSLKNTERFNKLKEEHLFLQEYKEIWSKAPFPPTFVTVNAVVIKSGHVLVVKRNGKLGKGLIALPGGFLNQDEKIEQAVLRELKEETKIKISKSVLRTAIKGYKVFDHPERSLRGRTITHAYLIDLGSGDLPAVKGSSDADKAWWMPLNEFMTREQDFFEDHWHIIAYHCMKY